MSLSSRVTELLNYWFINGIDVNIQDQNTELVNLYFSRQIQSASLTVNTTINSGAVTISSVAEPTDGNIICLKEGSRYYQGTILSHAAASSAWTLTLDTPLDYAFTTAAGCGERDINMNIDGSVTPVEFSVTPIGLDVKWDIYGMIGTMLDQTDMDDNKFCGATALTKGVVFRKVDGTTKNYFNVKSNGDIKLSCDLEYSSRAPSGYYGLTFHYDFREHNGVSIRLDPSSSDEFVIIIQDDLTVLNDFKIKIHGHVVSDPVNL